MLLSLTRLLPALLLAPAGLAGTIFVDANLSTGLNDGSSWANALQGSLGLQDAMLLAVAGDEIFTAEGTYVPTTGTSRITSFRMINNVGIYGGFLGTETSPDQRPAFGAAPSVLTADTNGNGSISDNSYHVIRGFNTNSTAILDGFVVRDGFANSGSSNNDRGGGILLTNSSPTIRNCHFIDNRCTFGGGAGYINNASPNFTDCIFEDNIGGSFGGAFDIATAGNVRFDRCQFLGNSASRAGGLEIFSTSGVVVSNSLFQGNTSTGSGGGGGLWIGSGGSTQVINCTIVANNATANTVGGLLRSGSSVLVRNTILWDNAGPGGAQNSANQISSGTSVTYSIVEGGFTGTGNLSSDPTFNNSVGGDFTLGTGSPAIDAGNNASVPGTISLDLAGNNRFDDVASVPDTGAGSSPIVDIGAFEVQGSIGVVDTSCPPLANSTGFPASLAANGSLVVSHNQLQLNAVQLPTSQFGYFVMSRTTANVPVGSGRLCLGAPLYRFNTHVLNSGASGTMGFAPDLTQLPQGQVFLPGESWSFQLWFRDGTTSNFTNGIGFTWQ